MICVLILAALPVAMIVIGECVHVYMYVYTYMCTCEVSDQMLFLAGSIYIDNCSVTTTTNRIPIWLVVFGCVSLVQTFINICKRCTQQIAKSSRDSSSEESSGNSISRGGGCVESFLSSFLFVWIIVGSVWVFSVYHQYRSGIERCSSCCHDVPYLFSFIVLLVIYTVGALFCCCLCCCFSGLFYFGATSGDE